MHKKLLYVSIDQLGESQNVMKYAVLSFFSLYL